MTIPPSDVSKPAADGQASMLSGSSSNDIDPPGSVRSTTPISSNVNEEEDIIAPPLIDDDDEGRMKKEVDELDQKRFTSSETTSTISKSSMKEQQQQLQQQEESEKFELADIVEIEIQQGVGSRGSRPSSSNSLSSMSIANINYTPYSDKIEKKNKNIVERYDPYSAGMVAQTAKLANDAKNDRIVRRLQEQSSSKLPNKNTNSSTNNNNNNNSQIGGGEKSNATIQQQQQDTTTNNNVLKTITASTLALDEDVAYVDKLIIQLSKYVILCWLALVALSYYIVPKDCIQYYEGTERNAALVELSILSTAVIMKHFPLLWDMNFIDLSVAPYSTSGGEKRTTNRKRSITMMGNTETLSGILTGGLVVQFIAIMTVLIMVCCPVPVMIDPILGSRVHFLRWSEWVPLAGFMTFMTECIDAPILYDGKKLTHPWRKKSIVSIMESLSTACGFIFPFCTNLVVWLVVMIVSCVTYSTIIFSYFEKKKLFQSCMWSGGRSVDEIELYERARMSLALHGVCCVVWTLITLNYFVTSAGHLVIDMYTGDGRQCWMGILHDPAATMIGECFMDLLAKCLYMALIIEAHHKAFDEVKRANRRLAELRNTMSVVWENSSDTIAISVQKISGNVTTMVSPSFFRSALMARKQQEAVDDISAIVLEHRNLVEKRESITDISRMKEDNSEVGIKIVRKADFASVDLHAAAADGDYVKDGAMTSLAVLFTDMLARAWQSKSEEVLFEHDSTNEAGSGRTKFEVKVTRLEENAIVVVVRNVSERYRRFEAEKRFVFETTARQKDAEANRFTRHEVKNGLLAAIEICGNVREQMAGDFGNLQRDSNYTNDNEAMVSEEDISSKLENMTELDRTLHEVLDLVLAETMARDVIHEMYVPRLERMDINYILQQTRGFRADSSQFALVCRPSPLPVLLSDQGLFKCIYGNAIRNAIKYGEHGGKITTEATYYEDTGTFELRVINLPGPGHEKLFAMGSRASELVFSHGTRLHKDSDLGRRSHSAGDGAWIMRKCANILNGTVEIIFEEDKTIFQFRVPVEIQNSPSSGDVGAFHLPRDVWCIGIDDSKIQRKLLRRFFQHAGVREPYQVILGQNPEEIAGFVEFVVDFVNRHPRDRFFLIADENLEMDGSIANHETISGSECIKQIRSALDPEQESRMLALVRSANDSPQDLALYQSRAHGYMPKVPLRGLSVRETIFPLWKERFPNSGENLADSGNMPRIASIENLRDLTLISPAEILASLEQIDSLCVRKNDSSVGDRWPVLWDKLHQLKGDLLSVNIDDKFATTTNLIESLRGESQPADFMSCWLRIRADVVSFLSQIQ